MNVRVRFAPSPTGNLHLGGARTALFNYLFARKNGGKFILRIEDTDKERSKSEYEANILVGLKWLGLDYDEKYKQSERTSIYREHLEKLIAGGQAYISKEEIKKAGDRAEVIRLKNPGQKIKFYDLIRGEIVMDTTELGDLVIAKDLDTPIFHFTNAVDDLLMQVTHIIRGDDHIANTPRQILIMRALGADTTPQYAHIPLILAPDRSKLSKRDGAVGLTEYETQGYLPAALFNFLATLGWSPQAAGLEQEILSREELIKYFDLAQVQKSGAVFNQEKLDWFNSEYLKRLSDVELLTEVKKHFPGRPEDILHRLLPEIRSRIKNFADLNQQAGSGEWDYFFLTPQPSKELLGDTKFLPEVVKLITPIPEDKFEGTEIKKAIWDYATAVGKGAVLGPLRLALSGQTRSADPFTIAAVIGKEETLKRLNHALQI